MKLSVAAAKTSAFRNVSRLAFTAPDLRAAPIRAEATPQIRLIDIMVTWAFNENNIVLH